jgi:hypothetical protein
VPRFAVLFGAVLFGAVLIPASRRPNNGLVKTWVLLLAMAGCADGQPDFRKAAWGMTQAQVRATESAPPAEVGENRGEVVVKYDGVRVGDLAGRAVYIFAKDRLVRAKYLFDGEHRELNEFIRDFRIVEPILIEKFGRPAVDRAIWEDDSTQLEPKSYLDQDRASAENILPSDPLVGLAVSLGHLKLYTQFAGTRTKVIHLLTGQDHHITHEVEFRGAEPVTAAGR